MAFDVSRIDFDPRKNYAGVVMEQGRVQLDSDWNEWLAELNRRLQAETLDLLGHAAYPLTTPAAFQIRAASGPNAVLIGCGRMYVDGLLAENHGLVANEQWDAALAELSGAPQPPADPPPTPSSSNAVDFEHQPYYPTATLPAGNGPYLFYLDVWLRPVTWLEDPDLIEKAVGVDTTGRIQTVWQVKWLEFPDGETYTCSTPDSQIAYPPASTGLLTTGHVSLPDAGPCCLSDGTGYTGLENQLYRVEVHQAGVANDPGNTSDAGFKWSRDNASVATGVTAITSGANTAGDPASVLTVMSLGRDDVLGFAAGDWIEVLDDWSELAGIAGAMCQIDSVDPSARTITLTGPLPAPPAPSFPVDANGLTTADRHTRIVRWDQSGTVYAVNGTNLVTWCDLASTGGVIPIPVPGTTLLLEDGITVTFTTSNSGGSFNVGDFWTFAARTADGSVEELAAAPPRGIHHHYTKLSVVDFSGSPNATDCRTAWPPSGDECGCCCTCTVGPGARFSSIQQAVNSLPTTGGEVCILPGRYFEHVVLNGLQDVVIHGCGAQTRIASPSLAPPPTTEDGTEDGTAQTSSAESGLAAVITLTGCEHIELRSFAVEAADDEVAILLDRAAETVTLYDSASFHADVGLLYRAPANIDVAIEKTVLTASTLPTVVALDAELLAISDNRIAMADVAGMWPAVYVSGAEIRIDGNWVGLQDADDATDWIPASVAGDLAGRPVADAPDYAAAAGATPGGIQIAGPSRDVFVIDNEIEGGSRNGITLGSISIVDDTGTDTQELTGLVVEVEDPCATTGTLGIPGTPTTTTTEPPGRTTVAGGRLLDITIGHNRISGMGLCGIGPVGFFDLAERPEVISIENLTITDNEISDTLLRTLSTRDEAVVGGGYGAICVPDVQSLVVRDNTITDFGAGPTAAVCGVFVLHGQGVELSRNRIIQTAELDLSAGDVPDPGLRGGIVLAAVTPPAVTAAVERSLAVDEYFSGPVYETGLPALRVEHNVVRVPVGIAFGVLGFGAFSLVNNFFSSGELIDGAPAATVQMMNLGLSLDLARQTTRSSSLYSHGTAAGAELGTGTLGSGSAGTVLFTDNLCEVTASTDSPGGTASVFIVSLDHLLFANNRCRVESPRFCLTFDAVLAATTVQVDGNRFQEAFRSVFLSAFTTGIANITSANLSTYCVIAVAATPALRVRVNNLALIGSKMCDRFEESLSAMKQREEG